jgi:hypothetical protein
VNDEIVRKRPTLGQFVVFFACTSRPDVQQRKTERYLPRFTSNWQAPRNSPTARYRAVELWRVLILEILDGCTDECYEFSDNRTRELVMCQALA